MLKKVLFDEQGLKTGTLYSKGQWKEIASHTSTEIKGFFGDYRFLSNFWPAKVFLDNLEFSCVENAYQAAKYQKVNREYFVTCTPKEAIIFVMENPIEESFVKKWDLEKVEVMKRLLLQKFNQSLNPELYEKLQETENKYLEETNYWGDTFWGVSKSNNKEDGVGGNNLGKLLMEIRGFK
jgi:ribA/ribD-fused uncharacterized protein